MIRARIEQWLMREYEREAERREEEEIHRTAPEEYPESHLPNN